MIGASMSRRVLAWVVVFFAVCVAADARADFTHYSTVRTESGGLVKYELYGNFGGPTDTVLNAFHISLLSGGVNFHHADALNGGVDSTTVGTWDPNLVLVPGTMDSYVCIGGGEGFASGNSTAADPDWGAAGFAKVQIPYGDGETSGPGWFNENPSNNQGRVNGRGQVKLGQFVIALADDAALTTIRLNLGYNDGAPGSSVQFADATFLIGNDGDCNGNGVPDVNDIAEGTASDCDGDGVLDVCEGLLAYDSSQSFPFSGSIPVEVIFDGLDPAVPAGVTPRFEVRATADLGAANDGIFVQLDGGTSFLLFLADGSDCPSVPDLAVTELSITEFNALIADGQLRIGISALGAVNTANCAGGGISVRLVYESLPPASDCNGNLILDSCEIDTGALTDCNGDRLPDVCQLASGEEFDCNGNDTLDSCDLATGSSTDLDGNGVPDDCTGEYIVGGSGYATIQSAVDAAPDGATVFVAAGVHGPIDLSGKAVHLRSLSGASVTSIDGSGSARCVSMQAAGAGEMILEGFTMRNGFADCGGGARITLASPTFIDCVFTGNATTVHGGALALHSASAHFVRCDFVQNTTDGFGGAVFTDGVSVDGGSVFESCRFEQNAAGTIGGAILNSGQLGLVDCTVELNTSLIAGGGASFLAEGTASMSGTRFCRNTLGNIQGQYTDLGGNILSQDCDGDGLCDYDEIAAGSEIDCNGNGVPDPCEIGSPAAPDCNGNAIPDACDIAGGSSQDVDFDGQPDECQPDCDGDGLPDSFEVAQGAADCDGNGIPDSCDISSNGGLDCDGNGAIDSCDVVGGAVPDCNGNGVPDSCDVASDSSLDCDGNGAIDSCDVVAGAVPDCNGNGVPDSCDLAAATSTDLDGNGVPDECAGEYIVGGSGYATIQAAINAAPQGALVLVAPGMYDPINLTGRALTLRSIAGPTQSVIDGGGSQRCLNMQGDGPGETRIEGFTLRNGSTDSGGAARITLSSPVFVDCVFTGNNATTRGGALALLSSAARFMGCTFVGNQTQGLGGAVYTEGVAIAGQLEFDSCVFTQNAAGSTGGAMANAGQVRLVGCTIEGNSSVVSGGGASFLAEGTAWLQDTLFCLNTVGDVYGEFTDLGGNAISQDCDADGICDYYEIADGSEADCDGNGIPDACDLAAGVPDCNANGVPDTCDIAFGSSQDIDGNGVPDDCKPDCDGDGLPDAWELANGFDSDCDQNGAIDSCQIAAAPSLDDDRDGRLDSCESVRGDLNLDGVVNGADLAPLLSLWGFVNPPVGDLDGDGTINGADLAIMLGNWGVLAWDPVLSSVEPGAGTEFGGTMVILRGAGLGSTSAVYFDGVAANAVTVVNATTVTAVTPPHAPGFVSVEVVTDSGEALVPGLYEYTITATPDWATLIEALPDPAVVYDVELRAAILATGWAWRVRDNGTGIEMLLIPPGSYDMGCSASNLYGCNGDEYPVHPATITQPFYMSRTEVTQAQWMTVMGSNPSYFQSESAQVPASEVPNRPVEQVSWNTIQSFMSATGMRLPTDAEWEYAYRAGTTTAFHGWAGQSAGTNDDSLVGNIAWYYEGSCPVGAACQTRPVGGKAANGFGLHDMAGNVWEWVSDWYSFSYYASSPLEDPQGPTSGSDRVLRGGSWGTGTNNLRSSDRFFNAPGMVLRNYGFRVARAPQ